MADSPVVRTTRWIAFCLMALFAICLLTTLAVAVLREDKWLSTFKDGFAFLAGSLATIVGYYFGNRNTDVALEQAKQATDKAVTATESAKQAAAVNDTLKREFADALSQDDAVGAIEPLVMDEDAGLTLPRIPNKGN
ncbi:MAG TPA: hypothetical protein VNA22_06725 [Pyrinomonadaceae bacterium]|nr:hypothetical protein [Pyrinomonadaceae bacterium]